MATARALALAVDPHAQDNRLASWTHPRPRVDGEAHFCTFRAGRPWHPSPPERPVEARGEPFLDRLPSTGPRGSSERPRCATRAHRSTAKRTVASARGERSRRPVPKDPKKVSRRPSALASRNSDPPAISYPIWNLNGTYRELSVISERSPSEITRDRCSASLEPGRLRLT